MATRKKKKTTKKKTPKKKISSRPSPRPAVSLASVAEQILDRLPQLGLRPYQCRWIRDSSQACFAAKSARIGLSYATGWRRLIRLLAVERRTCTVLSASKAQSIEFVDMARQTIEAIGLAAQSFFEEPFVDLEGTTSFTQSRILFGNGSRLIALPANPRTARGYPGDAVLDEFAHHQDSYSIWAAVIRQIALGHEIDVLSTPNGAQGKFFELAKDLGLAEGAAPPEGNPLQKGLWSAHWIDAPLAVREGCPIDLQKMRELVHDEDTFAQEFLCAFLKASGAWLPLELVARCEDPEATLEWPAGYVPCGLLVAGIDVARDRDSTVLWMDEVVGDVSWTRMVLRLHGEPFPRQHEILAPWVAMTTRTALDSTGMGVALYDSLDRSCPGKVMGVNFAGSNDQGVKLKTDLAIRIKSKFERARSRIPHDFDIRQELMAVKREATSAGVRFDAPRIELRSAGPAGKKKAWGHADAFWAKALADLAADRAPESLLMIVAPGEADPRREITGEARREMMDRKRAMLGLPPAPSDPKRGWLWD